MTVLQTGGGGNMSRGRRRGCELGRWRSWVSGLCQKSAMPTRCRAREEKQDTMEIGLGRKEKKSSGSNWRKKKREVGSRFQI
jgi:hypothetical protein